MHESTLLAFHEWLDSIAWRVHALVRNPTVLERFHEKIWRWYLDVKSRDSENEVLERRRNEHMDAILADPRLCDETAGPPQPEWKWWQTSRLIRVRDDVGSQDQMWDIEGWAPRDLIYSKPKEYWPLPLSKRPLRIEEEYTLLAAIHNHFCKGVKRIDLRPERDWGAESVRVVPEDNEYVVLCHRDVPKSLKPENRPAIEAFLVDVEADLRTAAAKLAQELSDAGQPRAEGEGEAGARAAAGPTNTHAPARHSRGNGMSWETAKEKGEEYVRRNGFPGFKPLIRAVTWAVGTMKKAIDNSTYLKARKAEYEAKQKSPPSETSLTDVVLDNTVQATEGDPSSDEAAMPRGSHIADIVVRVYEDHTHDKRLAARLAARRIVRERGASLDNAERDVLERVRRGELACDSPEVSFCPTCFVTVNGEHRIRDDVDRATIPFNSFHAAFFRELECLKTQLWKRRMERYTRLGGSFDATAIDDPLWDYVREWVAPRLRVEEAELRLRIFAQRAAEERSRRHDPVANELARLDSEGFADELLRDIWTLYPVQAVDLELPKPADTQDQRPPARHSLDDTPMSAEALVGNSKAQPVPKPTDVRADESGGGEPPRQPSDDGTTSGKPVAGELERDGHAREPVRGEGDGARADNRAAERAPDAGLDQVNTKLDRVLEKLGDLDDTEREIHEYLKAKDGPAQSAMIRALSNPGEWQTCGVSSSRFRQIRIELLNVAPLAADRFTSTQAGEGCRIVYSRPVKRP